MNKKYSVEEYYDKIFSKSAIKELNPYSRGEEAYFGENNPLKLALIQHIENFRKIYDYIVENSTKNSEKKQFENSKELKNECERMGKTIASQFNIEKCYVGIIWELNAFAYPMCWDKNLTHPSENNKNKYVADNKYRKSLEDIVETKNGFKYKDKKDKIFVIALGLGFFRKNYSDAEIAAILLHELGHCHQQMLCGINENIASVYIAAGIQQVWALFNPLVMILTLGLSWIAGMALGTDVEKMKKMDQDELGKVISEQVFRGSDDLDRKEIGDEVSQDMTDKTLKFLSKYKKKKSNIFVKALKFILGLITGTIMTVIYTVSGIIDLIDVFEIPGFINRMMNKKWLEKNRRFEQFADHFAAIYGLGPEQASALAKIGKEYEKVDLDSMNWVNYMPIINVVINWKFYHDNNIVHLMYGYPNAKKRIVGLYRTLKYELDNNSDLTSAQKKDIMDQINEINKIYDDFVFGKGSRNFCYRLYHKVIKASLENESSDIEENVLKVINESKDDPGLQEIIKENKINTSRKFKDISEIKSEVLDILKTRTKFELPSFMRKMFNIEDTVADIIKSNKISFE